MRLLAATTFGTLLLAASSLLLWWSDGVTGAASVAGATGVVLSAAFFGLTFLAWRWRASSGSYVATVSDPAFYDELAAAFDETTEGYHDAPSMHAAR